MNKLIWLLYAGLLLLLIINMWTFCTIQNFEKSGITTPSYYGNFKLAIVAPVPGIHLKNVLHNIKNLWNTVRPCESQENFQKSQVDIIFYSNGFKNSTQEQILLKTLEKVPDVRKCFNKVLFMEARLNSMEDKYPFGANNMFCR